MRQSDFAVRSSGTGGAGGGDVGTSCHDTPFNFHFLAALWRERKPLRRLSGETLDQTFRFWKQSHVPCQALPGEFIKNNLSSFTLPSVNKSAPSNC